MSITIAQVIINDSSDKTITGAYVFDRERGGSLSIPALNSFPITPLAGELIWRIDENLIYRRNDTNTAWDSIYAQLSILNSTIGDLVYYNGTNWVRLPAGISGQFLQTNGDGQIPNWESITIPDGAVSGTGYSINNSVSRFNGTDGYSIKTSLVTIDDNGNISTPGNVDGYDLAYTFQDIYNRIVTNHGLLDGLFEDGHPQYLLANGTRDIDGSIAFSGDGYCLDNVGCIVFSRAKEPAEIPYEEGKLFYDTDHGSLSFYGNSLNTSLQIGQELVLYCYNGTASTITNGTPVYIIGEHGNRPSIAMASATTAASANVIGLATENISSGQSGYITIIGLVHDVNTLAYPVNTRLYLSTTAGQLTTTPPTDGNIVMFVGIVSFQHQTQGIIAVSVKTPASIQTLHDVYNGVPTDGYHLYGNGNYWTAQDFSTDVLNSIGNVTNYPTGFPVSGGGNLSTISKVDATRTFTITPTGTDYNVYVLGNKFVKTVAESVVWSDVEGIHLFYFDANGTLTTALAESVNVGDVFVYNTFISGIYWDATNKSAILFADERHGLQMDGYTHLYLHSTQGAKWSSGGALTSIIADGTGALNSHSQFGVDACIIWDEDIKLTSARTSQVLTNPAVIPIVYRIGATGLWRKKTADTFPLIQSGSVISGGTYTGANGLPAYNQWTGSTWQLTEVATGRFMCVHYYMTSDINTPIVGVLGQSTYINAPAAKEGAKTEINTLQGVIRLFAAEAAPLATVLYQVSTSYANTSKARIISPDVGATYIDLRGTAISGSGIAISSTFADSVFRVYDNLDNTKTIALEASSITTGTTRTLTVPDRNITIGNVLGPIGLSSTDNAIARWDGTTGQLIQNSLVTIDDNGNISTPGTIDGYDLSLVFQNTSDHISNTSNPHNTTLVNIGSGTLAQLNSAISDADVPPTTRSITAGNGLTGGGDLSADRTIAVAAADTTITVNADSIQVGVITDTNHGTRGGGTLHSVATTSVAGFESAADKTKLDQLVNNSHLITVSATQPTSPTTGDIWIDISGA